MHSLGMGIFGYIFWVWLCLPPPHPALWRRPSAASTTVGGRFAAAHCCGIHNAGWGGGKHSHTQHIYPNIPIPNECIYHQKLWTSDRAGLRRFNFFQKNTPLKKKVVFSRFWVVFDRIRPYSAVFGRTRPYSACLPPACHLPATGGRRAAGRQNTADI